MDQATLNAIDSGNGGVALRIRAFELACQVVPHGSPSPAESLVAQAKIIEAYLSGEATGFGDEKPSDG